MWRDSTATPHTPLSGRWDRGGKIAAAVRQERARHENGTFAPKIGPTLDVVQILRLTTMEHDAWKALARADGITLAAWIRAQCRRTTRHEVQAAAPLDEVELDAQAAHRMRAARDARRLKGE